MLTTLLDGWFKIDLGEGAFYSVFGFVFVFLGIVVLIAIFTLLGLVMKKLNARPKRAKNAQKNAETVAAAEEQEAEESVPPEVVAAITAALACYTEAERQKCDFVVKRIRKL